MSPIFGEENSTLSDACDSLDQLSIAIDALQRPVPPPPHGSCLMHKCWFHNHHHSPI